MFQPNKSKPAVNAKSADLTFNSKGLGSIEFGAKITTLPSSMAGIYNDFTLPEAGTEDEYNGEYYYEFSLNGKPSVTICTDEPHGKISRITVYLSECKTKHGIHPGMSVADLWKVPGIKFEPLGDEGASYFLIDDYIINYEGHTKTADAKLERGYQTGVAPRITAADFLPSAKVTSITLYGE